MDGPRQTAPVSATQGDMPASVHATCDVIADQAIGLVSVNGQWRRPWTRVVEGAIHSAATVVQTVCSRLTRLPLVLRRFVC